MSFEIPALNLDWLFALVAQMPYVFLILAGGSGAAGVYGVIRHSGKVKVKKPGQVIGLPTAKQLIAKSGEEEVSEEKPDGREIPHGDDSVSGAFREMLIRGMNNSTPKFRFTGSIPVMVEGDKVTAKAEGKIGEIYFDEEKADENATPSGPDRPELPPLPIEETGETQ